MEATEFASRFINNTNRHIFLTGKAGTGKTTFLRKIIQSTHKNTIVAAPTGIAAINAQGVTLHSLFQLPFGTFIPENITFHESQTNLKINTPASLFKDFSMNSTKRKMLQELELLIIDEVSMLRADLLDAIDTILRNVRKKRQIPFGGIQVLFIGDLLQLPPVVKHSEEAYLSKYYASPYFFNAKVLQQSEPVYIELNKIYRQSNQDFISILNNLRNNTITANDITVLNQHYKPGFDADKEDGYIQLTTHNQLADDLNNSALKKLDGKSFFFEAEVVKDFDPHLFPVEGKLELKVGAQVMFIKNDYSGEQRYYNGKIGFVSKLQKDLIEVSFKDGSDATLVEPYTWENKRYTLNKETNEIEEKIIGEFIHYPIKLAWAITIHKSQGLTFEKAIIDVSKAFAPGQMYVALSRLTSLDGLVLSQPISNNMVSIDKAIESYAKTYDGQNLELTLNKDIHLYIREALLNAFNFSPTANELKYHILSYNKDEKKSNKQQHKAWAEKLYDQFTPLQSIADKFTIQLRKILKEGGSNYLPLTKERVNAAINYFSPLFEELVVNTQHHLNNVKSQKGTKKYLSEIQEIEALLKRNLFVIKKTEALIDTTIHNKELSRNELAEKGYITQNVSVNKEDVTKSGNKKTTQEQKADKKVKVNTKQISFDLYQSGKSVKEIASDRSLATTTIEGHLAHFIEEGVLKLSDFLSDEKYQTILPSIKKLGHASLTPIKENLGENISFAEIRFAIAGFKLSEKEKV